MTSRQKKIEQAYIAAQKMSNWLYNVGQHPDFKHLSKQMRKMVNEWDQTKKAIALETVPKARKAA